MSFLESPKKRPKSFAPTLNAVPLNSTHVAMPGCVQCGSLLEASDKKKPNFSGKCFSCECWVSDEDEQEDDDGEY
jgi:hypothetical protein